MPHLQSLVFKDSSTSRGSSMDACSWLLHNMDIHVRRSPSASMQSLQTLSIILGDGIGSHWPLAPLQGEDWGGGGGNAHAIPTPMQQHSPSALPMSNAHMPGLSTLLVECTGTPIASLKLVDLMSSLVRHRLPSGGPKMQLIDMVAAFMPPKLSDKGSQAYRLLSAISETVRARFVCSYCPGMPVE